MSRMTINNKKHGPVDAMKESFDEINKLRSTDPALDRHETKFSLGTDRRDHVQSKSCAGAADHRGLSSQCPRGAGVMIRANRPAHTIPNWLNIFISVSLDLMNSFSNAGSKNRKLTGCSRMSDSHFVCLMIEALRSKLRKIFDSQGKNLKHDSLAYACSKLQEMRSLPNSASGGLNKWIDQITSEIQY
jgi:hypothetical protein